MSRVKVSVKEAIKNARLVPQKRSLSWYDNLNSAGKKWCDELKSDFKAKKCLHIPMSVLASAMNESLGLEIGSQAFRNWIKKA